MKRISSFFVLIFITLACNLSAPEGGGGTPIPSAETPSGGLATPSGTSVQPDPTLSDGASDSGVLVPLDAGSGTYKGLPLGLQDNGEPIVTPVDGVIGVVCIGMSNANQECDHFIQKWVQGEFAGEISPQVRFVNCAVGGNAIERWNDPAYDDRLWGRCIDQKISEAGLRADQIRVIWHKAANMLTTDANNVVFPPYPDPNSDYFRFYDNLTVFAARVSEKLPSVQAVYTSSRSYGGFAKRERRGEPLSYEEGLALNEWLKANPTVNGVWYGWGPYIWAPDCAAGLTNGSGMCYERSDYQDDGVHPAQGAKDKISEMLHARFSQFDWYRAGSTSDADPAVEVLFENGFEETDLFPADGTLWWNVRQTSVESQGGGVCGSSHPGRVTCA